MTAKEKFLQAINEIEAKRVTEFGWANVPDKNVWLAYNDTEVHIFSQPEGDEFFDHYTINKEQCHLEYIVLYAIIRLTNIDDKDFCAEEDERIILRQFAYDETEMTEEDLMHAIWYLWEFDDCITNSISKDGWSQHVAYKDDDEDLSVKLRLTDSQKELIKKFESVAKECNDAGICFVLADSVLYAYNSSEYYLSWEPDEEEEVVVSDDINLAYDAMEYIPCFSYYLSADVEEAICKLK